jgi:hypothetical protein
MRVVQRILEAIDLLEGTTVEANTNANAAVIASNLPDELLLSSRRSRMISCSRTSKSNNNKIEEEEDGNDEYDYFQYKEYTNVAVTYNDGNVTVVTCRRGCYSLLLLSIHRIISSLICS